MIKVFNRRYIGIFHVNGDNEFEYVRDSIAPVQLDVGAGERVGDMERANRFSKEGSRCEIHQCLYR